MLPYLCFSLSLLWIHCLYLHLIDLFLLPLSGLLILQHMHLDYLSLSHTHTHTPAHYPTAQLVQDSTGYREGQWATIFCLADLSMDWLIQSDCDQHIRMQSPAVTLGAGLQEQRGFTSRHSNMTGSIICQEEVVTVLCGKKRKKTTQNGQM